MTTVDRKELPRGEGFKYLSSDQNLIKPKIPEGFTAPLGNKSSFREAMKLKEEKLKTNN